jgi:hypothetical protein
MTSPVTSIPAPSSRMADNTSHACTLWYDVVVRHRISVDVRYLVAEGEQKTANYSRKQVHGPSHLARSAASAPHAQIRRRLLIAARNNFGAGKRKCVCANLKLSPTTLPLLFLFASSCDHTRFPTNHHVLSHRLARLPLEE